MDKYFQGKALYGDDFNLKQIKEWYEDEKEGYSSLDESKRDYEFHALNKFHGFNKIPKDKKFSKALGLGSAYGYEFLPVIKRIKNLFIIEPSKRLRLRELYGKKINYRSPKPSGDIPFDDRSFDLICCFSVLHHIPNVSHVLSEMTRVTRKGGYILIREPTVSMGDWKKERKGVTKRERGIPLDLFREMINKQNLEIVSERRILFPTTRRIKLFGRFACNMGFFVMIDYVFSKIFSFNKKYHAESSIDKLQPQAVFYVLKKR